MIKDFIVNVSDLSQPILKEGSGRLFILDNEHDIPYKTIFGVKDLPVEVTEDTKLYKLVSKVFAGKSKPRDIAIYGEAVLLEGETVKGQLEDLINEQKSDWFFLLSTMNDEPTVKQLAQFAEENDKMYFVTTQNLATASTLKEIENTVVAYHDNVDDYTAEGLAKNISIELAGEVTAKFQEVAGSVPAEIGLTELKQLHLDNGLTYVSSKGIGYISEGKTTNGSYIDTVVGGYFIKLTLEEALFRLAINNKKIPYSDNGIAMIIAEVENVLKTATAQGVILEKDGKGAYEINALTREEISKIDLSNRIYNGVSVKAVVAGAIHSAEINIDLVLSEEE